MPVRVLILAPQSELGTLWRPGVVAGVDTEQSGGKKVCVGVVR